jgi:hypothetical protein
MSSETGMRGGQMTGRHRAMRGGQPSMTTPTPPPWDSPKVWMRKSWPKGG